MERRKDEDGVVFLLYPWLLAILVEIQQVFFFFLLFNPMMIGWCLKFIWRESGELNITWASLHVKELEKIGLQNRSETLGETTV